jgi:hypothetical protein
MDKETQRHIDKINASIPRELVRKLLFTPKDEEAMLAREQAEWQLKRLETDKNKMTNAEADQQRKALNLFLSSTERSPSQVVNDKIAKEIDLYLDTKIKQAIQRKTLNPANPHEVQRFMRQITHQ